MAQSHAVGRWGEDVAERHFLEQGYRTVGRNVRWRGGEMDLVMRRENAVLFVEVKTRHAQNHSSGPQDVHPAQVRRLARMIEWYVMRHNIEEWRLVLACVVRHGASHSLRCVDLTDSLDLG